jgi:hypothetical protein
MPKPFDLKDKRHPIHKEIQKIVGTINLTATIQEDLESLSLLKTPGLVAFACFLKRDGELISIGRGAAVLNRLSKYLERVVMQAANASLVDAIVKSTKVLDMLRMDTGSTVASSVASETHEPKADYTGLELPETFNEKPASPGITEKQKGYLKKLITENIKSLPERDRWESEIDNLTSAEASQAIQQFKK